MKNLLLFAGIATAASAKTVKLGFWKDKGQHKSTLSRRSDDIPEQLTGDSSRVEYFINITIGTPPQRFALQLDTGSSDTWVPSADSYSCSDDGCSDYGAYNKNVSSTYSLIRAEEGLFSITYGDLTYASGDYFTDVLSFGQNMTITNVTMANANDTDLTQGLLGVGLRINEASENDDQPFTFPTVPEQLKAQGKIDRVAYSLYLDSYDDNKGSILFGGIDSSRYTGELLALPLSPDIYGNFSELRIALTKISIHDGKNTRALTGSTFSYPALLDSGTTLSYLTQDVSDALTSGLGGTTDVNSGDTYVPCSYRKSNVSVIYTFGGSNGVNISVPLTELISEQLSDDSSYADGTPACSVNFAGGGEDPNAGGIILGDSFLRSAYVVYDLENRIIAIAQAKLDNSPPINSAAITAIPSGTALPGVTRTVTVTATQPTDTTGLDANLGTHATPTFSLPGVTIASSKATATVQAQQSNGAGEIGLSNAVGVAAAMGMMVFQLMA